MTMKQTIKNKLSQRRKKHTQQAIATKLNISQPYLSQIINGQRNNPKILKKIETLVSKN
jgi:transcriptional regulator with XRE-family HTH domain